MPRKAASDLRVDSNIRADRVYPIEGSKKTLNELKTVALRLNKDQAIHLATTLLVAARNWEKIDLTAFRFNKRKSDGTHIITVSSFDERKDRDEEPTLPLNL